MILTPSTRQRRGVTAVIVVALLILLSALSALLLQTSLSQDRLERATELESQTNWLLEAGAERAWLRLQSDHDYSGETWDIPAESLGAHPAKVTIRVSRVTDPNDSTVIETIAEYPTDGSTRIMKSKRIVVQNRATQPPEETRP